jgi:hypothetical protein
MKLVRWTTYALREITKREIDRAEVELTLHQPDAVIAAPPKRPFTNAVTLTRPSTKRCFYEC